MEIICQWFLALVNKSNFRKNHFIDVLPGFSQTISFRMIIFLLPKKSNWGRVSKLCWQDRFQALQSPNLPQFIITHYLSFLCFFSLERWMLHTIHKMMYSYSSDLEYKSCFKIFISSLWFQQAYTFRDLKNIW